jgi:hypothetical protein
MSGVHADDTGAGGDSDARVTCRLTLDIDTFAWEALEEESAQQGVSIEELASFAILYYLADSDSGRIARRLPQPQRLGESHPPGKPAPLLFPWARWRGCKGRTPRRA